MTIQAVDKFETRQCDTYSQHYMGYFMPPKDFSCSLWELENDRR